jgi:ribosome-binding factor A
MTNFRLDRVAGLISQVVSEMIVRQEIKDPRVNSLLSISEVDLSKDLGHAKVGISGFASRADLEQAAFALNKAAGFIQARLGKSMRTRLTPKLQFFADFRVGEAFTLTKTLEDLVRDIPTDGAGAGS